MFKDRTHHNEFLKKLASLMQDYNAEINVIYHEGCECCGCGDYEIEIETGGSGSGQPLISSSSYGRYLYSDSVRGMIE